MADLTGKKVAVVVDDYFEQAELTGPVEALKNSGATVHIIAAEAGEIHGLNHVDKGDTFQADGTLGDASMDNYDALVLPGGTVNSDALRMNETARKWATTFIDSGKPVAAICHAPWLLASSGIAKGKKLTSFATIQDDMRNAGAQWVDEEVVVDGNLITSRQPDDIPAFNNALIGMLAAS